MTGLEITVCEIRDRNCEKRDYAGTGKDFALTLPLSTSSAPAITSGRAWCLVGFMWVAYFLNYSDRQVVFSIFPILKSELGFTDTQLGLTGSIFLWVYAFCSPIAGQVGEGANACQPVCPDTR